MKHTTKAAGGVSVVSTNNGPTVTLTIQRPGQPDAHVNLHPAEAEAISWALLHQAQAAELHTDEAPSAMLMAARGDHIVTARAF